MEKSIRKTIAFNLASWGALVELIKKHGCYAFRRNTIVQAAIFALAKLSEEEQRQLIQEVHKQDRRFGLRSKLATKRSHSMPKA